MYVTGSAGAKIIDDNSELVKMQHIPEIADVNLIENNNTLDKTQIN